MDTINLDLPHDYFKRDPLRAIGVSRVGDNEQSLLVSFSAKPTDDDLRKLHDHLRSFFGSRQ